MERDRKYHRVYLVFKSKAVITVLGGRANDGRHRRETLDKKTKRLNHKQPTKSTAPLI